MRTFFDYAWALPRPHLLGLAGCFLLVVFVALWPTSNNAMVVKVPAQVSASIPKPDSTETQLSPVIEMVKAGDTLSTLFERSGAGVSVLYRLLSNVEIKAALQRIFPGQEFVFYFDDKQMLAALSFSESRLVSYDIEILGTGETKISKIERTPEIRTKYAAATITDSLFLSGMNAGLTDNMIMQVATLFGWDIDFALDIREGDQFSLLYEENYVLGEKLSDGPIVAAKFINNGRAFEAIRYTDESGRTDYYSPDGKSMRKAFLRTPLDVFRISSHFNPKRKHPILNKILAHKGTDYAAPVGTPIKVTGDGKVIKAYYSNSYGNVVIVQHGSGIRTLYAHMSQFSKYSRVGRRVKQGQIIGYVGTTGRSTGPHLHYEFQVQGVHKNPQTVQLPNADALDDDYIEDFYAYAANIRGQLGVYDQAYAANGPLDIE